MLRVPISYYNFPKYDDEDVIKAWKWFMSFVSVKGWSKRKCKIEQEMAIKSRTTRPFSEPLTEGTLLVLSLIHI